MKLFHRRQYPPIGLEITATAVRMLQVLDGAGGGVPVVTANSRAFDPDASEMAHVAAATLAAKNLAADGAFAGRRVIVAIPDEFAHLRTLRFAATESDGPPSDQSIRTEAAKAFDLDLASAHLQYLYAGKIRTGSKLRHEIIAAACPTHYLESLAKALDRAGLEMVAADVAPCAIYRGVTWSFSSSQTAHAVIDVGEHQTQLIVGRGDQVRLVRTLSHGAAQLREAVGRRLGIAPEEAGQLRRRLMEPDPKADPERESVRKAVRQACRAMLESLAEEIVQCLRYDRVSFGGATPRRLLLAGADAGDSQTQSILESATGLPAQAARPLEAMDLSRLTPADRQGAMSDWALPLGLALRNRRGAGEDSPADSDGLAA